jgi:hypothetical protein
MDGKDMRLLSGSSLACFGTGIYGSELGRWDTRWNKGVDAGGIPLEFEGLPYLPLVVYVGAFP